MTPKRLPSLDRGTTLIELAVASFLLGIVLTLSYMAMESGVKKYHSLRSDINMQQDALAILARLSREASEGHSATLWPDRSPGTQLSIPDGGPMGIVFLSPRDDQGRIVLDPSNSLPMWQKRICYLYDPGTGKILRSHEALSTPSSTPPARDDSKTTSWFQANVAQDPLPGQVEGFEIEVGDSENNLRFNLRISSESGREKKTLQFLTSSTLRG